MEDRLKPILRTLRQQLEALYGARLVDLILYGSQAHGDMTPESDVDVLVVLAGQVNAGAEVRRVGGIAAALSLQHDVVISCMFVSHEQFRNEQSPYLMTIRQEGIPV
jgi:predicted nucleotidyltransferase